VANFIVLIILCTVNAVGDGILQGAVKTSASFYEVGASVSSSAILDGLVTFGLVDYLLLRTYSPEIDTLHVN
jgi:phospholipid-translocating ATPase